MGSLFRFSVATRAALIGMFMAATLFGVAAGEARADIVVSLPSLSEELSGDWEWEYTVGVAADQRIEQFDYFTIYDFLGFVLASNEQPSADWAFTSPFVSIAPPHPSYFDDPTIENLTWTYMGSTPLGTGTTTQQSLGIFAADSDFVLINPETEEPFKILDGYVTMGTIDTAPAANDGTKKFTSAVTEVPGDPVPEPGSMILLGTGLFGAAAMIRRRRSARSEAGTTSI